MTGIGAESVAFRVGAHTLQRFRLGGSPTLFSRFEKFRIDQEES
jgi:hypothetical protein